MRQQAPKAFSTPLNLMRSQAGIYLPPKANALPVDLKLCLREVKKKKEGGRRGSPQDEETQDRLWTSIPSKQVEGTQSPI